MQLEIGDETGKALEAINAAHYDYEDSAYIVDEWIEAYIKKYPSIGKIKKMKFISQPVSSVEPL